MRLYCDNGQKEMSFLWRRKMTDIKTLRQEYNQLAEGEVKEANPLKYRVYANSKSGIEKAEKLAEGPCRGVDMEVLKRKLGKDYANIDVNSLAKGNQR